MRDIKFVNPSPYPVYSSPLKINFDSNNMLFFYVF